MVSAVLSAQIQNGLARRRSQGEVLGSFASKVRDKAAALTFIKKAMKRHGRPRAGAWTLT